MAPAVPVLLAIGGKAVATAVGASALTGAVIGGALASAAGAYMSGARGKDVWRSAGIGAVTGGAGQYASSAVSGMQGLQGASAAVRGAVSEGIGGAVSSGLGAGLTGGNVGQAILLGGGMGAASGYMGGRAEDRRVASEASAAPPATGSLLARPGEFRPIEGVGELQFAGVPVESPPMLATPGSFSQPMTFTTPGDAPLTLSGGSFIPRESAPLTFAGAGPTVPIDTTFGRVIPGLRFSASGLPLPEAAAATAPAPGMAAATTPGMAPATAPATGGLTFGTPGGQTQLPEAVAQTGAGGSIASMARNVWGNITDRVTDPERLTDLAILAAASALPVLFAGTPPDMPPLDLPENFDAAAMREGLSDEERWLLDQQIAELQRLYEQDQDLFFERINAVQSLLSQAEYFDPDYWGNMSQRNIRSGMARQQREMERDMALTGRPMSETVRRQQAVDSALAGETAFLQGADAASAERTRATTGAIGLLPSSGPSTFGDYSRNITGVAQTGMDRMQDAYTRRAGLNTDRINYFNAQSQDYARRLAAMGGITGNLAGPLMYPRDQDRRSTT